MTQPEALPIASAQGNYVVEFLPSVATAVAAASSIPDTFFLVDRHVHSLYRGELALDGRRHLLIDATEEEKTIAGVTRVLDWLQRNDCTKKSTVVAIGVRCRSAHGMGHQRGRNGVHRQEDDAAEGLLR